MSRNGPLRAMRYLHTIHAALSCEKLRQLYCAAFGGIVFAENYYEPEDRDAALLYVADHMIEVMSPRHPGDHNFMFARFLDKIGPSYHSISFAVPDAAAALDRCGELGLRISTTGPGLLMLHPKSTGGIIVELTHHQMPNDPGVLPHWRRDWAEGRPNRPHALAYIVCAPRQPMAAITFLVDVLGGTARSSFPIDWPQRATATPVDVADAKLLILDPTDRSDGALANFMSAPNAGVYALAWRVADSDGARTWFAQHGVQLERTRQDGTCTHEATIDGARHWFIQSVD